MGSSRFWLKMVDVESKSIPHELPSSHWLKATGQCVLERYLSATMSCAHTLDQSPAALFRCLGPKDTQYFSQFDQILPSRDER